MDCKYGLEPPIECLPLPPGEPCEEFLEVCSECGGPHCRRIHTCEEE